MHLNLIILTNFTIFFFSIFMKKKKYFFNHIFVASRKQPKLLGQEHQKQGADTAQQADVNIARALSSARLCSAVRGNAVLCWAMLCCARLCSAMLGCTVLG